jgi:hypothetical protein
VKGDKAAQEKLPKVMQDKLKLQSSNSAPKGSRSYSTMITPADGNSGLDMGLVDLQSLQELPETPGLKFQMPSLPLPKDGHVKHRYDPVVEQVTNLLMRHGKKSVAQRVCHHLPGLWNKATNMANRIWPWSSSISGHHQFQPSTHRRHFSLAHLRHPTFR